MDTLRGALHAEAAALRKRLVDIDMLMKRISNVTVARTLREDELANNLKTKFLGASSDDECVVCSKVNRDEYKAFINGHGRNGIDKTVRMVGYLVIKSAVRDTQV